MKKTIISSIILFIFTTASYADYSNNPKCKGFGIMQHKERQACLKYNGVEKNKILNEQGKISTKGIREKTGKFFKKLGVNTDSKLFKTGKYSENK